MIIIEHGVDHAQLVNVTTRKRLSGMSRFSDRRLFSPSATLCCKKFRVPLTKNLGYFPSNVIPNCRLSALISSHQRVPDLVNSYIRSFKVSQGHQSWYSVSYGISY